MRGADSVIVTEDNSKERLQGLSAESARGKESMGPRESDGGVQYAALADRCLVKSRDKRVFVTVMSNAVRV